MPSANFDNVAVLPQDFGSQQQQTTETSVLDRNSSILQQFTFAAVHQSVVESFMSVYAACKQSIATC